MDRSPQLPSQTPGGYCIESVLATGGMSLLLLARRRADSLPVVFKTPRTDIPQARERFIHEARALVSLSHPHIVRLLDIDCLPSGIPALVLEYVPGVTLRRILDRGPLPAAAVSRLASCLAEALDHCHRRGIVHRDLKPENIMVGHNRLKIIDFGLARLLSAGAVSASGGWETPPGFLIGTPPYTAPEQIARPRTAGAAADAYSLGVLLAECVGMTPGPVCASFKPIPLSYPQPLLPMIQALLNPVADQRPTLDRLVSLSALPPTPAPRGHPPPSHRAAPRPFVLCARSIWLLLAGLVLAAILPTLFAISRSLAAPILLLTGSSSPGIGTTLVLDLPSTQGLLVRPLGDTRIRLSGSGPWSDSPLRIQSNAEGLVRLHIIDDDGSWRLTAERR